jgi:hypothetical protein
MDQIYNLQTKKGDVFMKILKLALCAVLMIVLTASLVFAVVNKFSAHLEGKTEVPAVKSKAGGDVNFTVSEDGKEITYVITVKNIENVTAAHIHVGKRVENGKVVAGLFMGPKKEGKFSGELAKGTITHKNLTGPLAGKTIKDLVEIMKRGDAYVNVHTTNNPKGEIRGEIYFMP